MRHYFILSLLLVVHIMARGQTSGYKWHYWYDDNSGSLQSTSMNGDSWQRQADVQQLREGVHTIYTMVADAEGRLSAPVARQFVKLPAGGSGDTLRCLCYVDGQEYGRMQMPAAGGSRQWTLDMSGLSEGIHRIQLQTVDASGAASAAYSSFFLRSNTLEEMKRLSCICVVDDSLYAKDVVVDGSGQLHWDLDMSGLSVGIHRLQLQAIDASGAASGVYCGYFLRCDTKAEMKTMHCLCYVDDELYTTASVAANEGLLHWELDMDSVGPGLHRMHVQVIAPSGASSTIYNRFFLRLPTDTETDAMCCLYVLDDETTCREIVGSATPRSGVKAYHFDLDLSDLSDGLHRISYCMGNGREVSTQWQSRFFIKTSKESCAIRQYDYWVNDSVQQAQGGVIQQPANPLQIVTMLPVPSHPIRSQNFHFEVTGGTPMVYAKNDFHIRFYDALGRWTHATSQYIDYNVGQEVADIETLEPGTTTTDRPGDNAIKWYCLKVKRGDNLSFMTDAACTLQLFLPSGQEVYAATGGAATRWGGALAPETGTYYLALHDVTDANKDKVGISYMREEAALQKGDVNGDGAIDVADIAAIVSVMAGSEVREAIVFSADVNGDGSVDVADIASVVTIMAEKARMQREMEEDR